RGAVYAEFRAIDFSQSREDGQLFGAADGVRLQFCAAPARKVVNQENKDIVVAGKAVERFDLGDVPVRDDGVEGKPRRNAVIEADLQQHIERAVPAVRVAVRRRRSFLPAAANDGVLIDTIPETVDLEDNRRTDVVESPRECFVLQS